MKKQFIFLTAILLFLLFNACRKNDNTDEVSPNVPDSTSITNSLGTMPSVFEQRVLIEELTGEWCPGCVNGAHILLSIKDSAINGGKVDVVSIHDVDWLEIVKYDTVRFHYWQAMFGFPCATVGRVVQPSTGTYYVDYTKWQSNVTSRLAETHDLGIALISKLENDSGRVEVHIGHNSHINDNLRLTIFVTEDNVLAQNQLGSVGNFFHQQVVRLMPTNALGDDITFTSTETVMSYSFPVVGYKLSDLKIVAMVSSWNYNPIQSKIWNSRTVKFGQIAKWK